MAVQTGSTAYGAKFVGTANGKSYSKTISGLSNDNTFEDLDLPEDFHKKLFSDILDSGSGKTFTLTMAKTYTPAE